MLRPHLCQAHNGQAGWLQGKVLPSPTVMGDLGLAHITPSRAEAMGDNTLQTLSPHFWGAQNQRSPDFPHHPPPHSLL